jgi:hypothetical protein
LKDTLWLFGAGASFGSGDDTVTPHPTPLGGQLAMQLAAKYDWWSYVVGASQLDWSNFEAAYSKLLVGNPVALANGFRPIAHYFTQFRISHYSNLYARLIRELKSKDQLQHTAFSTLNYDSLLEQGVALNSETSVCLDYQLHDPERVVILKLHGSCHFAPNPNNYRVSGAIMPAGWMNLDVPIVELTIDDAAFRYDDTRLYRDSDPIPDDTSMPIMSIYHPSKKTFLGESTILQIQRDFSQFVGVAGRINIVGVFPNPHDRHIWEPLACTSAHIAYCSKGATDAYNNWRKGNKKRDNDLVFDGTWEEHFGSLI